VIEIIKSYGQAYIWWDGANFSGLIVTIWLLAGSLSMGFVLSLPLAMLRVSRKKWLSGPVWIFTYIFRGTPLYIQLLIIYSGLYQLDFIRSNVWLDSFFRDGMNCAILALGLNTTAYTTEMFAGAMRSISRGEIEAAQAFGFSQFAIYRKLIIPAALRRALPAYSNEVILMLHSTAIAFTATVPDILKVAGDVNADTYQSFHAYGIAALIYLASSFVLIGAFRLVEQRVLAFAKPRTD
jgi:histidine transport system permease protein